MILALDNQWGVRRILLRRDTTLYPFLIPVPSWAYSQPHRLSAWVWQRTSFHLNWHILIITRDICSLSLNVPIWHSLTTILIPCHHSSSLFIHIPFRPKCTQKISISPCAAPNARKTTTPPTICYLLSPALFACPPRISLRSNCATFLSTILACDSK